MKNKRNLKISLIVSDLSSSGAGRWGGAVRPFLLAQALQKLDYQVEIVGLAFNSDAPPIYAPGISVTAIPCEYYSGIVTAAKELLPKINGDIIYAVKLKTTSFGLAVVKKLISNRPLILDIDDWELSWHGGEDWKYHPNLKQLARDIFKKEGALRYPDHPLYLKLMEKLVSYADVVTTHSEFLLEKFGGVYVPNGKDTELFDPGKYDPEASRKKYGLSEYRVLMFPGAPRPYKGVEDVLIALEKLNQPDLKLVIVGGSPYDDYDSKLMAKWGQWIIKLPRVSVEDMPEVVAAAHIVLVPQRDTPAAQAQFPLKLTDGMAMAKPILATKVGGIPTIIGETGYLVEPSSPEEIAAKIQLIFDDLAAATAKGQAARERCVKYLRIENMSAILEEIIAKLK